MNEISKLVQKVKWNLDGSNTEMYVYGEADFEANKAMQEPLEKLYQYENQSNMREKVEEYIKELKKEDNMVVKRFDEALMNYSDEFLLKAYQELKYMSENGYLPSDQMYFRELVDLRTKLYKCDKDNDATKKDLFNEIARRWVDWRKEYEMERRN